MATRKSTKKTTATKTAASKTKISASKTITSVVKPTNSKMDWKSQLKNPRILLFLAILIIFGLIIILGQKVAYVAYVNGQPITRIAYYKALEDKDGQTVMQNLVIESLINQEASKRGINVTTSDVQKSEKNIENQLAAQGETLDGVLAQQGMTKSEFEDQLRVQQQVEKLLGNKVNVTDKQIDDYIAANKDSLPQNATGSALRAEVKQQLEQQNLTTQFQTFIANLQKSAHITYLVNNK